MFVDIKPRIVKPPFGSVQIDWGHPLTQNLLCYVPVWEGGGSNRDMVANRKMTALVNLQWKISTEGIGLGATTSNTSAENQLTSMPGLSGLSSATWVSRLRKVNTAPGSNESMGFASFGASNNLLNRNNSAGGGDGSIRGIVHLSTTDADLSVSTTFTVGRFYTVAWVLTNSVLTAVINGIQLTGSGAGTGTIVQPTDAYFLFGSDGGASTQTMVSFVGLIGSIYGRALSLRELLQLHNEPYAFLRPIPAVRYWSLPPAAPAVTSGTHVLYLGRAA